MDILHSEQKRKINLKCKYHQEKKISLINIGNKNSTFGRTLLCSECIAIGQVSGRFVTIRSILDQNKLKKINNWPLFQNEEIQKLLNQSFERSENINDKVISCFDSLKQNINGLIENLQKKILLQIGENQLDKLLENILENSQLNELSNIITSSLTYDEIDQSLNTFLEQCALKFQKLEQDLICKKELLNSYQYIIDRINKIEQDLKSQLQDQLNSKWSTYDNNAQTLQLQQLKMGTTNYQNSQQFGKIQEINNNINLIVMKNSIGYPQIVSNLILEKDKKYLLRIEIKSDDNYYKPMIGLIDKSNRDTKHIFQENLCYYGLHGLTKAIKGKQLYDLKPNQIEIFISIAENKLLISDYPNHENVNTLEANNNNLNTIQNPQIGFSLGNLKFTMSYNIKEFSIINNTPQW